MPTQQEDRRGTTRENSDRQALMAVIGAHLLHALGQPDGFQRVQVRPLWEDRYRVNVFLGADVASARVAHSYFLVADGEGNILASTPAIQRCY